MVLMNTLRCFHLSVNRTVLEYFLCENRQNVIIFKAIKNNITLHSWVWVIIYENILILIRLCSNLRVKKSFRLKTKKPYALKRPVSHTATRKTLIKQDLKLDSCNSDTPDFKGFRTLSHIVHVLYTENTPHIVGAVCYIYLFEI